MRFPPPEVVREARLAAYEHKTYAEQVAVLNADVPQFGWGLYGKRAALILECWRALDQCYRPVCTFDGIPPLSERVRLLRVLIGEENYREGLMPLVP